MAELQASSLAVSVIGVHKRFRNGSAEVHVLKGVDFSLAPGQLAMLKGRSGSGKTTLMNLIGGLDVPSEGSVIVNGLELHKLNDKERTRMRRRDVAFVFQSFALHPLMTAWENVELGMRMAGLPSAQWADRIEYCLEQVGMAERAQHRPYELSGGEQQRVAIAKAIAPGPRLLLADEPTAELDTKMSARVLSLFQSLRVEEKMAILMTTHDQTMLEVADHVLEMESGKLA
ncbi:ABC transporter ATP-binding protein [Paenibacillus sp. GCM10012307]|uniref:ABC transporter ATP-binding protein n=1 Tax=Paenibacillus roseus TaxID=2798579 RepID=A0A934J6Y5_9BACL|nr:ABC transporter ATP-binding protein [Paenibacillus roseus]MBJ6362884.1 ABC transporter ATP-binding protein [Paenibacillus roseus]